MNDPKREAAYREILEQYDIDPADRSTCAGEDAEAHLSGEAEIEQFCVVTKSGSIFYAVAQDTTFENAKQSASAYIDDSVYPEAPVAIYDLDTGDKWEPEINVTWEKTVG